MKKLLLLASVIVGISQTLLAENSIGIGYGVSSPIYHSDKNDYILPLVNLNYNGFFVKGDSTYGLSLGYNVLERDNYILSLYGMPFGGYKIKGKDMKDGYKGIDERKTHLMGGVEFTYFPHIFELVTSVSAEFGDKGGHVNLRVSRPFYITPKFTIVPTVTYTHYTANFIDYYFGVDSSELNRPNNQNIRETYDGKSAYRYGVGLLGNYKFTENISVTGFTGVTKLSDEITNSPIADKDIIFLFGTGVVYTF